MPTPEKRYRFGIRTRRETIQFLAELVSGQGGRAGESPADRVWRVANENRGQLAGPTVMFAAADPFPVEDYSEPPPEVGPKTFDGVMFWRL
jgi:hypothetical protein